MYQQKLKTKCVRYSRPVKKQMLAVFFYQVWYSGSYRFANAEDSKYKMVVLKFLKLRKGFDHVWD